MPETEIPPVLRGDIYFMLYRLEMSLICGTFIELSCFELSKLEADLEVSILELYYTAKSCFREYEKGNVCGKVAILNFSDYEKVS